MELLTLISLLEFILCTDITTNSHHFIYFFFIDMGEIPNRKKKIKFHILIHCGKYTPTKTNWYSPTVSFQLLGNLDCGWESGESGELR